MSKRAANDPLDDIEAILDSMWKDTNPREAGNTGDGSKRQNSGDEKRGNVLLDQDKTLAGMCDLDGLLKQLQGANSPQPKVFVARPRRKSRRKVKATLAPTAAPRTRSQAFPKPCSEIAKPQPVPRGPCENDTRAGLGCAYPAGDTLKNPHENVPSGNGGKIATSSDEADNERFMKEVKRLASEKREAEKCRIAAARKKTVAVMRDVCSKQVAEMRQIASGTSQSLTKAIISQRKIFPTDISRVLTEVQKTLKQQEQRPPLSIQVGLCYSRLRELTSELRSQQHENEQACSAKERRIVDSASSVNSKAKQFNRMVSKMSDILQQGGENER